MEIQVGRPGRTTRARKPLLALGVLSTLVYATADLLGGLVYEGYSFTSQAISELMARGAPSERLVDPLFLLYDALVVAFGVGVLRAAEGNRALRIAGILLITYGLLGVTGPTLFEMNPRGTVGVEGDFGHILVTAVMVMLLLLMTGAGGVALGKRFRIYSFATLATVIAFGALSAPYGTRLAAGEPTAGFGVLERVNVYSSLLWIAVLAIALWRRGDVKSALVVGVPKANGFVAPGFEEVRAEFERNLAERGDIGAAVAAYWRGEKVVDLWGGYRAPDSDEPWEQDTMVVVMSTTKGMAAMTLAVAHSRGWLDYEAPVARYWPEFAQHGKDAITVRQLFGHEAGLVLIDEKLTLEKLRDLDYLAGVLARQRPAWPPGTRHGYHTVTIGLYMQELIRRVDPKHRSLGRFFQEEIARPLGIDFYIGLPREIPDERIAGLKALSSVRGILALRYTPLATTLKMIAPGSLLRRSFLGADIDYGDRRWFDVEIPAGNGVGTARALARAYSVFAEGGAELGITPETFALVTAPPIMPGAKDVVLGVPSYFALGFLRPGPDVWFGSSERAFGAPGAGGSFAFADPDARVGYAYIMNKLDFYLEDDPREKALRDAVYRAIARLSAGRRDEPTAPLATVGSAA